MVFTKISKTKIFNYLGTTNNHNIPTYTQATRPVPTVGLTGDIIYQDDTQELCYCTGNQWICLSAGSGPSPTDEDIWEQQEENAPNINTIFKLIRLNTTDPYTSPNGGDLDNTQSFLFGSTRINSTGSTVTGDDTNYSPARMYFAKANVAGFGDVTAFRVGIANGTQWDIDSGEVGQNSFAANQNTIASGEGSVCFGSSNTSAAQFTTIAGGSNNQIQNGSIESFIGAGNGNTITDTSEQSGIVGGDFNRILISSIESFIGGGNGNTITDSSVQSVIVGGESNTIQNTSTASFIGGGNRNTIQESARSVIVGGVSNRIENTSTASFIGGGNENTIQNATRSIIGVGFNNTVASGGESSIISGTNNTINGGFSGIVCGSNNTIGNTGEFINNSIVLSGETNQIIQNCNTCIILGGTNNRIFNGSSTSIILSGGSNGISDIGGNNIIGNGTTNNIDNSNSANILNGRDNSISSGTYSTIINGEVNNIQTSNSFIGGGNNHQILNGSVNCCIINGTNHTIEQASSFSTILNGSQSNRINRSSDSSILGGHSHNIQLNPFSAICCGVNNTINDGPEGGGSRNMIACGQDNTITDSTACSILSGDSKTLTNRNQIALMERMRVESRIEKSNIQVITSASFTIDEDSYYVSIQSAPNPTTSNILLPPISGGTISEPIQTGHTIIIKNRTTGDVTLQTQDGTSPALTVNFEGLTTVNPVSNTVDIPTNTTWRLVYNGSGLWLIFN